MAGRYSSTEDSDRLPSVRLSWGQEAPVTDSSREAARLRAQVAELQAALSQYSRTSPRTASLRRTREPALVGEVLERNPQGELTPVGGGRKRRRKANPGRAGMAAVGAALGEVLPTGAPPELKNAIGAAAGTFLHRLLRAAVRLARSD